MHVEGGFGVSVREETQVFLLLSDAAVGTFSVSSTVR